MADAAVQEAIYALQYRTGDSVQQLQAARTAAIGAAQAADKFAESEVNVSKATLQVLAALDPRIRAEQRAAQQLEKISSLYRDGRATAEQYSMAVGRIQENYLKVAAANDNAITSVGRFSGALGVARNLLGAFGIALSATAIVSFTRDVLKTTADLDDQADVLGITTDALQAYRLAATEAGSSTQFIQTALERYVRSVGQARDGNKPLIEAFQELGITADDLAGDPGASLPKVVQQIMELENVTDRAAKLTVIFGRGGQQMEQVLKSWASPLDEQIARFEKLNLIVSREQIEAIDRAQARWELFFQRLKVGIIDTIDLLTGMSPNNSFAEAADRIRQNERNLLQQRFTGTSPSGQTAPVDAFGFPSSINVTGRRADPLGLADQNKKIAEDWATEMDRLRKEQLQLHEQFWKDVAAVEERAYEQSTKEATDYWKNVDAIRDRDEKELNDFHTRREAAEVHHLERVLKEAEDHWKEVDKLREDSGRDYERQLEREREQIKRYWEDVSLDLTNAGKSFWMEFAETGRLNFKDLFGDLKATFARVLYEMIIEARLRPIILNIVGQMGLGGGAAGAVGAGGVGGFGGFFGGQGGGLLGPAAIVAMGGSMVGSSLAKLLGGSPTAGGIGGALLGGIPGGIASLLFKGLDKASNYTSTATFTSGMTDFGFGAQSAHESSEATLGGVQQAAEAIRLEILALKTAGVQFTQQLANVWLGARDESTFQMVGGQRISAGSVGDPLDLAKDALAALLKSATSSDPEIQKILSGGGTAQAIMGSIQALQMAKAFSAEVEMAILQIKDPMQAAIELWKKDAQARLDAAAAMGTSIDKVKELNALLFQQITAQQNAGAISGLDQFVNSLKFGPGSAASPQSQITSAFSVYDAARQAALANPSAQTAAAFQQAAGAYLPIAREYYGTTATYQSFVTGAINTADQLKGFLSAPTAMPDLQPVVMSVQMGTNMTVDAITGTNTRLDDLNGRVDGLTSVLESLLRQLAPA